MLKLAMSEGRTNPHPVRVTDLFAVQTSHQYTTHLLCHQCEQRFHADGENWVLRHCWRGTTFPLHSMLTRAKPDIALQEGTAYRAAGIPGINVSALTYFAASMFWRAAVHNWSGRCKEPAIDLGPYREQLRSYLNGTDQFPKDCALVVFVPDKCTGDFIKLMAHPYPTAAKGFRAYRLRFLGITFGLNVGRQILPCLREGDFVRGAGNPIIVVPSYEDVFRDDLRLMFRSQHRTLAMLNEIDNRA